ncbi:glycosyltransferase family 4 protein [Candidatus Desantisbacteria bacterium]|nr:glycosyltransferase family 4 protein [Candidatus Desantisbacteria bacterium]
MKIAIPIIRFDKQGGIERHTYELVKELSAEHEVHIFAHQWEDISNPRVIFHYVPVFDIPILPPVSFPIMTTLMIKQEGCDVVYNNGAGYTFIQDVITTASLHTAWMEEAKKNGLRKYFLNPLHYYFFILEKYIYKKGRYKKIIAISNFIKAHLMTYFHIPEEDIIVIYHGVNLEEFNPENKNLIRKKIRDNYQIKENETLLLFVGKEYKRKGLRYIIDALDILQRDDIKLLVVGKDTSRYSKALATSFDKRVIFAGHSQDVASYYAAADIFVFPTTFDAFGMVVLEAMAAGLPVIVSNKAGSSELIENRVDGIVLNDCKNAREISQGIAYLMKDREAMKEMGEKARKKAERYSWEKISMETLAVFEEVFRKKQRI